LSAQALRYVDAIWSLPPEEIAPPETPGVADELARFHYGLIQEQLEKDLKSHRVLEDLLRESRDR
jgi:hypothetical protein